MDGSRPVLVLDPSLGASGGHHAPLARALAAIVAGELVFAGARGGRLEGLRAGASFAPVFSYRVQDAFRVARHANGLMGRPMMAALSDFTRPFRSGHASAPKHETTLSQRAFKDLFAPLRVERDLQVLFEQRRWRDVISIAADPAMVSALAAHAGAFAAVDAPRLHLVFMYPERDYLTPRTQPAHAALLRELVAWPKPPALYAELREHAVALQAQVGAPVLHQTLAYRAGVRAREPAAEFTVAVLGAGRADKGFALLPAIVEAVHARAPQIRFRIQGAAPGQGLGAYERALKSRANVVVLAPSLSEEAYDAELASASVILLAYDLDAYARRGSGVFVDAAIAGVPVVCVAATAMARALQGNGISGTGAAGLADAIIKARDEYDPLSRAAVATRDAITSAIRHGPLMIVLNGTGR